MAKKTNFKRIRKIADVAEHNRKYGLTKDSTEETETIKFNHTDMGTEPELTPRPVAPSLGQLFSFCK